MNRQMSKLKRILTVMLVVGLCATTSFSQNHSVSLGNFYVPKKGKVAIFSSHNFAEVGSGMLSGLLATDRSKDRGHIVFSAESNWVNASTFTHIDGYVLSTKNEAFVYPVGDNGIYAPVGLSNSKNLEAAYFAVDPTEAVTSIILSDEYTAVPEAGPFDIESFTPELLKVSDKEYWDINGETETKITLTWDDHSDIDELVKSDLNKLTVVGWDGVEWVPIKSSIDERALDLSSSKYLNTPNSSNLDMGSITTAEAFAPNEFYVYTLGYLAIDNRIDRNTVSIYPNPVKSGSFINVRYFLAESNTGQIKIFNSNNQLIITEKLNVQEDKIELPLGEHKRGIFTLALTNDKGHTVYKKLIVVDL